MTDFDPSGYTRDPQAYHDKTSHKPIILPPDHPLASVVQNYPVAPKGSPAASETGPVDRATSYMGDLKHGGEGRDVHAVLADKIASVDPDADIKSSKKAYADASEAYQRGGAMMPEKHLDTFTKFLLKGGKVSDFEKAGLLPPKYDPSKPVGGANNVRDARDAGGPGFETTAVSKDQMLAKLPEADRDRISKIIDDAVAARQVKAQPAKSTEKTGPSVEALAGDAKQSAKEAKAASSQKLADDANEAKINEGYLTRGDAAVKAFNQARSLASVAVADLKAEELPAREAAGKKIREWKKMLGTDDEADLGNPKLWAAFYRGQGSRKSSDDVLDATGIPDGTSGGGGKYIAKGGRWVPVGSK
jgi:hypothetical protein